MAGLSDMIYKRKKYAGGGMILPSAPKFGQAQDIADRAQQVEGGAFNTAPPPLARMSPDAATYQPPGAASPEDADIQSTGFGPRMLEAGTQDLSSSIKNALGATAQYLGNDNVGLAMRRSAAQDQERAEKISTDQVKNASDVNSFGTAMNYIGGQALRGLPSMAAMAVPGMLTRHPMGIAAPSFVLNTGGEYGRAHAAIDQQEQSGAIAPEKAAELRQSVPAHAFGSGALGAIIDTTAFGHVLGQNPIAKAQATSLVGHFLGSEALMAGAGAAKEAVEQVITKHVLQNPDLFHLDDEDKKALLNTAASNAAGALPFVLPGHAAERIGKGVDAFAGAAGRMARKIPGLREPELDENGQPVVEPSLATKAGNFGAAALDGNVANMAQYGKAMGDTLFNVPGVKAAVQAGKDFWAPLAASENGTKIGAWMSSNADAIGKGFDEFTKAYGAGVDTSNIEGAKAKYSAALAKAIDLEGYNSEALGKMSGEKVAGLVSGFNNAIPKAEGVIRNLYTVASGAVEGAKNVVGGIKDTATTDNLGEMAPSPSSVAAATSGAGGALGAGIGHAVRGADILAGAVKKGFAASPEENSKAMGGVTSAFDDGSKKSLVGDNMMAKLSPDASRIRSALEDILPDGTDPMDVKRMAMRFESVITRSPKEFYDKLQDPSLKGFFEDLNTNPVEFGNHVISYLQKEAPESSTPMYDALRDFDPVKGQGDSDAHVETEEPSKGLSGNEAPDEVPPGEGEITRPSDQALSEVDHPDQDGERHPAMTPEMFESMKATPALEKGDVSKTGSNASVRVTRTRYDPTTGEQLGDPTSEDTKLNLHNVASKWAPQREAPERARIFGERDQAKYDDNFKQGITAALQGWEETEPNTKTTETLGGTNWKATKDARDPGKGGDPDAPAVPNTREVETPGAKVKVDVTPIHGGGKPVENFRDWLRGDSVTGQDAQTGGPRTFGAQEAELRNPKAAADVSSAVDKYHSAPNEAYEAAKAKGWSDAAAERSADATSRQMAAQVARLSIEQFKSKIEALEPEDQSARVDALRTFLSDPEQRASRLVDPDIRDLPTRVLKDGKNQFMNDLDKLDYGVVQSRLKGEQETSVDNPERFGNAPDTEIYEPGTTQPTARKEMLQTTATSEGKPIARAKGMAEVPTGPRLDEEGNPVKPTNVISGKRGTLAEDEPGQRYVDAKDVQETTQDALTRKRQYMTARDALQSARGRANAVGAAVIDRALTRLQSGKALTGQLVEALGKNAENSAELEKLLKVSDRRTEYPYLGQGATPEDWSAAGKLKNQRNLEANLRRGVEQARSPKAPAGPEAGEPGVTNLADKRWERTKGRAEDIASGLSQEDLDTLQNDKMVPPEKRTMLPASLRDDFREWMHDSYSGSEREDAMAPENQAATERKYLEELADKGDEYPREAAMAKQILEKGAPGIQKSKADVNSAEPTIDTTSEAGQKKVIDVFQKIAGKALGTKFDPNQPHQAQWGAAKKLATFAALKAFIPSNAAHEAFHAVYDNYLKPEDRSVVYKAFKPSRVQGQIRDFLKESPEAWEAAKGDPNEMMAYGFQAWHAGALKFGPETHNVFTKIVDLYQKAMAWLHDEPTAQKMMEQIRDGYFADGGASPTEKALARSSEPLRRVQQVTGPIFNYADKLYAAAVTPYDTRLRDMGNPYVDKLARRFYAQVGEGGSGRGMVQEIPIQTTKFLNAMDKLQRQDPIAFDAALKNRAKGLAPSNAIETGLAKQIEGHYDYQKKAGVSLGKVENYLPMSWSGEKIEAKRAEFIKMLEPHTAELADVGFTPEKAADVMSKRGRPADEFLGAPFDETGAPINNHALDRVFGFLGNAEREPFIHDDLYGGMQTYIKQMTRRAEWARRFGDDSAGYEKLISDAKDFGLGKDDEALIRGYKDDAFAARLYGVSPTMRQVLAVNTVYQNYRVLGLSVLSNLIDPFGVAIRSGQWSDAFDSYKLAASRMFKSGRMRTQDLQALSEDIGSIQRASVQDSLLERYGGVNLEGKLGALNDKLFTYNGMNGLTRSVRLAALVSGMNFLMRHAKGYDEHSERHLKELGLKASDVQVKDGQLAVRPEDFVGSDGAAKAEKIQNALNRFVDESAMRPNVGERTRWGSNPYLAPLYHLKQYVFSFNKVINKKLEHELLEHNNVTPYLMAACYVPIMAGSAMLRDMLLNGGSLPPQNGFMHYAWDGGMKRSGLMGPSDLMELGASGIAGGNMNDLRQLAGPTTDQAMDFIGAISSAHSTHSLLAESLPGGSILQHYAR